MRDKRALYRRLLRDGARFPDPAPDLVEGATTLEALGLVRLRHIGAVLCANPDDPDFPPPDPDCAGLVELRTDADEAGGDYACPVCGRVVHPLLKAKQQVELLTVTLDQPGIERFVQRSSDIAAADQAFDGGILVIPGRPDNHFICIVDFCTDTRFLSQYWHGSQRCIYVVVDPRAGARLALLSEPRVVDLADLACGDATVGGWMDEGPRSGARVGSTLRPPTGVAVGPLPSTSRSLPPSSARKFSVGLIERGVLVDGIIVESDPAAVPYLSFAQLMKQAIQDVAAGRQIAPMTARSITERIRSELPGSTTDAGTVQKGLRRLDQRIVQRLRQEGRFIEPGDVIENATRAGKYRGRLGFRLNRDKVALDPATLQAS